MKPGIKKELVVIGSLWLATAVSIILSVIYCRYLFTIPEVAERRAYHERMGHNKPYCFVCNKPATHKSKEIYEGSRGIMPVWLCDRCTPPRSFARHGQIVDGAWSEGGPIPWTLMIFAAGSFGFGIAALVRTVCVRGTLMAERLRQN